MNILEQNKYFIFIMIVVISLPECCQGSGGWINIYYGSGLFTASFASL